MKKFYVIACHLLWRELCYYASLSENMINFKFLKQGLHNTPDILRQEVQDAIDKAPEEYDAILLGYGLCSNGIAGIIARSRKLVIMRGHDCITFLLGSKEHYSRYAEAKPGTYWYSPGWIETGFTPGEENYNRLLSEYTEKYGEDNAEYLMDMEQGWFRNYSNAAYVDFGFADFGSYRDYTKKCAEWLKWNFDEINGNPELIRDFVNGNWNDDDYLIVEPGETIIATHDENVIGIKKPIRVLE
jgi:hypothetical protein